MDGELAVAGVLEGDRAPPERERLLGRVQRAGGVGRQPLVRHRGERAEPLGVDVVGRDRQPVAGGRPQQGARRLAGAAAGLEHAPQPRHVGVHRALGVGRRRLAPQLVDDPVEGHRPVPLGEQQPEEHALQRAAELGRGSGGGRPHLDGAEQPVPHADHLPSTPA